MERRAPEVLALLSRGPASASDIARSAGLHQTSVSRVLKPLQQSGQVVRLLGRTRGARYGLARPVGSIGSAWPLYRISATGGASECGDVRAIAPAHLMVRGSSPRLHTLTQGLPYFLQDGRPGGFLGRAVPAAYPELALPARVQDWSDDHVLMFLAQRGSDTVGDLILGAESLDRHLAGARAPPLIASEARAAHFPMLADAAMRGAPPASSAQGEHPKCSARIVQASGTVHVLVKFSPPRDSALGTRWADLLVAECVASRVLAEHGIGAARSEVFEFAGRVFLESERFDRIGAQGRRGVVSLFSLDAARYGKLDRWTASAQRLHAEQLLSAADLQRISLVDAFGGLIANTDRHFGNLSLFDPYEGPFELAPIYDMLPMLFAPQDGQLVERSFEPKGPVAATLSVWPEARQLAEAYWRRLSEDPRLSEPFRRRCSDCLSAVGQLARSSRHQA